VSDSRGLLAGRETDPHEDRGTAYAVGYLHGVLQAIR
jgi:hypothetical protein